MAKAPIDKETKKTFRESLHAFSASVYMLIRGDLTGARLRLVAESFYDLCWQFLTPDKALVWLGLIITYMIAAFNYSDRAQSELQAQYNTSREILDRHNDELQKIRSELKDVVGKSIAARTTMAGIDSVGRAIGDFLSLEISDSVEAEPLPTPDIGTSVAAIWQGELAQSDVQINRAIALMHHLDAVQERRASTLKKLNELAAKIGLKGDEWAALDQEVIAREKASYRFALAVMLATNGATSTAYKIANAASDDLQNSEILKTEPEIYASSKVQIDVLKILISSISPIKLEANPQSLDTRFDLVLQDISNGFPGLAEPQRQLLKIPIMALKADTLSLSLLRGTFDHTDVVVASLKDLRSMLELLEKVPRVQLSNRLDISRDYAINVARDVEVRLAAHQLSSKGVKILGDDLASARMLLNGADLGLRARREVAERIAGNALLWRAQNAATNSPALFKSAAMLLKSNKQDMPKEAEPHVGSEGASGSESAKNYELRLLLNLDSTSPSVTTTIRQLGARSTISESSNWELKDKFTNPDVTTPGQTPGQDYSGNTPAAPAAPSMPAPPAAAPHETDGHELSNPSP